MRDGLPPRILLSRTLPVCVSVCLTSRGSSPRCPYREGGHSRSGRALVCLVVDVERGRGRRRGVGRELLLAPGLWSLVSGPAASTTLCNPTYYCTYYCPVLSVSVQLLALALHKYLKYPGSLQAPLPQSPSNARVPRARAQAQPRTDTRRTPILITSCWFVQRAAAADIAVGAQAGSA